jgi:hypothetical protein
MMRLLRANGVIVGSQMIAVMLLILATRARAFDSLALGVNVDGVQDSYVRHSLFDGPPPYFGALAVSGPAGSAVAEGDFRLGRTALESFVVLTADEGESHRVVADATAVWDDSFSILPPDDDPGLTGTAGSAFYFFRIDGTVTARKEVAINPDVNPVQARYVTDVYLNGLPGGLHERHLRYSCRAEFGVSVCGGDDPGLYGFEFDFIWGSSINLQVQNQTFASAASEDFLSESAHAGADFSHTFSWEGFGEVRDFNGNSVTGYRVESASGIDWSRPVVCEPASALALIPIAFLMVARRARSTLRG